ncbi:MAG: ABC transporter permease [Candidatus Helarchaeota archaeon]
MKNSFRRIYGLVKKEFRLLWSDKYALLMAVFLPPVIVIFIGVLQGISIPPPVICAVVINDSQQFGVNSSYISLEDNYTSPFLTALRSFPTSLSITDTAGNELIFNSSSNPYAMYTAYQLLLLQQVDVLIVIPPEFSETIIYEILFPRIEIAPDASDVAKVQQFINVFNAIGEKFVKDNDLGQQILYEFEEEYAPPQSIPPFSFNIALTYLTSMAFPFMVMGFTMILTILVIVTEAPIPRLIITPAKKEEILISKYITYTLVSLAQTTLIFVSTMACQVYVPVQLLPDLFLGLFITGIYGVTLGILISTISTSKMQANQLFFFIFLTILLLSGMIIPIESLWLPLQIVAYGLPMAWASPIFTNIIFKSQGFLYTWPNYLVILLISLIFMAVTLIWFRFMKKMEV